MDLTKRKIKIKTDGLFLVVLGESGCGKSHFMGTYPSGNVLHLHGKAESHGAASAVKSATDRLISVEWEQGNKILADLKNLLSPQTIKENGISVVGLDSLTVLARDLKETDLFKQKCTNAKGQHNSFKESEALLDLLSLVISWLSVLHKEHDIDIICSLHAQVTAKNDDETIAEAKPSLPTFSVAEYLIGQFSDVLILGRLKGEPVFQNNAKAARTSKDTENKITKFINFNPRLTGVNNLPATIEPSVKALLDLKKGN